MTQALSQSPRLLNIGGVALDTTLQVFRGTSSVFQSSQRQDLTYIGRLRGYGDISESTNSM
jgi:hypothetical protein